jgi:hypothetical protein
MEDKVGALLELNKNSIMGCTIHHEKISFLVKFSYDKFYKIYKNQYI